MTRRSALGALFVLGAGCGGLAGRDKARRLAPDFALSSLDGQMLRLSGLRGRPVLLNFWATWCAPCRIETPWLVDLYRTYHPRGMEFLGVSLDEPTARTRVADFAARMRVGYPVLLGTQEVADAYGGVRLLPQTFLISRQAVIAASTIGITSKADIETGLRALLVA